MKECILSPYHIIIIVAFLISQCLMGRIVKATYLVAIAEGAFRYVHGRLRTFAESIAFFRGIHPSHVFYLIAL
jgi:ABC-type uncharacterized transport system fused permease/ATPase subunit